MRSLSHSKNTSPQSIGAVRLTSLILTISSILTLLFFPICMHGVGQRTVFLFSNEVGARACLVFPNIIFFHLSACLFAPVIISPEMCTSALELGKSSKHRLERYVVSVNAKNTTAKLWGVQIEGMGLKSEKVGSHSALG